MTGRKVGIIFPENDAWTGGSQYVLNLLKVISSAKRQNISSIIVYYVNPKDRANVESLNLLHVEYCNYKEVYSKFLQFVNKAFRALFYGNLFHKQFVAVDVDVLYPVLNHNYFPKSPKNIYWIPDFQDHYLPHFFSARQLNARKKHQSAISQSTNKVVFSSKDAQQDYHKLFPNAQTKSVLLHFAVMQEKFTDVNIADLLVKYGLPNRYFFSPNQFWAHKNHIVILKALSIINSPECVVAFSGKETDHRNPGYFSQLKKYVADNNINRQLRFLGFIDRKDLLCLMSNATAIIQPSLFEGWSTVVEDAKALNKLVIASDIAVHREQLPTNSAFFNPKEETELAALLAENMQHPPIPVAADYGENIEAFRKNFIDIISI